MSKLVSLYLVRGYIGRHEFVDVLISDSPDELNEYNIKDFCASEMNNARNNILSKSMSDDELNQLFSNIYFCQFATIKSVNKLDVVNFDIAYDVADYFRVSASIATNTPVLKSTLFGCGNVPVLSFHMLSFILKNKEATTENTIFA